MIKPYHTMKDRGEENWIIKLCP